MAVFLYVMAGLLSVAAAIQWLRAHLRSVDHDAKRSKWLAAQILTFAAFATLIAALFLTVIVRYSEIRKAEVNCCAP